MSTGSRGLTQNTKTDSLPDVAAAPVTEAVFRDKLLAMMHRLSKAITRAQEDGLEGTVAAEIQVFGRTKLGDVTIITRNRRA